MGAVDIQGVRKSFGDVVALDGVELSVADGENVAILGPSGSGKSTLLRVIAGLEPADGGEILIDGAPQRDVPPHRRDVAIVFQHFALYPHLTARSNITLGLRHGLGLSKAEAESRAVELATRMQVEHLLDRKPREMSGGQRQRIALARALARRSGVVLLDEPLSGLDAQLHAVLRLEIASMLRAAGATGINVTHDQLDAMAMADRIAVIHNGRLEQVGTPDELYARPATLFVAGFIGSPPMNLLAVTAAGDSSLEGPVPREAGVTLGVRAEDLGLVGAADAPWRVSGVVGLVEATGMDRVVQMISDRGEAVSFRCGIAEAPRPGQRVTVGTSADRVHVYSSETGLRVGSAAELGAAVGQAA
ncbi:ABC transporter ATP-binding protein [Microbacterium album]|uniref:Sn-glycerol-3-phosphate import ATP-binding protein UgpC n=1 Tax=Microbacterium album TaxID=2053191 RepID=A0A917IFY1_9MICO|nr:ABC transporter ATP-binding protein [Microbacterium album]GGH45628.1 sn-glycerol-3-phosphate import ATP-binding protein UgpC [Microbacterium album]